jgi:hypothetical protein
MSTTKTLSPPPNSVIGMLIANVRRHVCEVLLSVGYSEAQANEIIIAGPDVELPNLPTPQILSKNRAWQLRRVRETLRYAASCEQAHRDQQWADAIRAAYLMGVTEGGLFVRVVDTERKRKGSRNSAKKKMELWPRILAEADRLYAASSPRNRPTIEALHDDVMKIPGMPQRGRSAFAKHWKAHRSKKVSK